MTPEEVRELVREMSPEEKCRFVAEMLFAVTQVCARRAELLAQFCESPDPRRAPPCPGCPRARVESDTELLER